MHGVSDRQQGPIEAQPTIVACKMDGVWKGKQFVLCIYKDAWWTLVASTGNFEMGPFCHKSSVNCAIWKFDFPEIFTLKFKERGKNPSLQFQYYKFYNLH